MSTSSNVPSGLGEAVQHLGGLADEGLRWLMAWVETLPPVAAAFVAVLALIAAVLGARRPAVRGVAAVVGFLLGILYATRFRPWLEFVHVPWRDVTLALSSAFAVFGALLPEGITFALGALGCGTIVASFFPSDDRTFAFIPAFLVGGAAGVMMFPLMAALVSSFGGGLLAAAAIATLLPRATLGGYLLAHPLTTGAVGLGIGLAGFLGQLRAPREELDPVDAGGAPAKAKKPSRERKKKAQVKASGED